VKRGDAAELCDRLARLIAEPQLRQDMGRQAQQQFGQHFTLQENGNRMHQPYQSLLEAS
jgi:glycosyltransferase involved in cell wall biosynthesis